MKICPTCRTTYADDGLNFCLEDGSVLTFAANDPAQTLVMNQGRTTEPGPTAPVIPGIQTSWDKQANYSMQPKKSSKSWLWVLGILGALVVVCGGGFVAFLAAVGSMTDENGNFIVSNTANTEDKKGSPSPSPFDSGEVQAINLALWQQATDWGTTEYVNDEFIMASKAKGYYYVLVAKEEYRTDLAATRVTVRNIYNGASNLGYGLIIHSDITPLTRDIAFLIDAQRRKYRIVRHAPNKENTIVGWTTSNAIKSGSQENVLEVRDKGSQIELYINGQLITAVKDDVGAKGGVAGLYTGDAVKIGFKQLEIRRSPGSKL